MAHAPASTGEASVDPLLSLDGVGLLAGLRGADTALAAREALINELNVFPVPDGDTGSNMRLTFAAALADAERCAPPRDAAHVMDATAHGALMGARGNSGVILSQIIRGLAHGCAGSANVDARRIADAFTHATTVADAAVINPIEGTILTVARSCARGLTDAARGSSDLREVLAAGARAAFAAVDATIDQLPMLRDAGVVDAGGLGLATLVAGFCETMTGVAIGPGPVVAGLTRRDTPRVGQTGAPAARGAAAIPARAETWGFCTEFIIEEPRVATDVLRALFDPEGDSLVVAGDDHLVRIHIHTDAPDEVIAIASRYGRVDRVKVEDMSAQHHDILVRAQHPPGRGSQRRLTAVVPVASGHGFVTILRSLGAAQIVDGGQTMNPSADELLRAVYGADAHGVILLPNNGNIILAAEQARGLAEGVEVRVVPTRSLPQGISALLSWDPADGIDDCALRMHAAAERTRSLEITRAVRDASVDGRTVRTGEVLAILDGVIADHGTDEDSVVLNVLGRLGVTPEFVTIYHGAGVGSDAAEHLLAQLEATYPLIGFELQEGGQALYAYVLGLE